MSIFSVVFQDFKLFSFGLGQNVSASFHYNEELAKKCLEKAGFYGRLQSMKNGGQIVQRGVHDRLLQDTHGKYYELWNAQAQYYTQVYLIHLRECTETIKEVQDKLICKKSINTLRQIMDRIFHKTDCATLTIFWGMYSLASVTTWQSSSIGCFFVAHFQKLSIAPEE